MTFWSAVANVWRTGPLVLNRAYLVVATTARR